MSVIANKTIELNIGPLTLGGELSEADRQCAWELHCELSTRVALIGKIDDPECENYDGEVLAESLDSVHRFFQEARAIMKKYPVGRINSAVENHLGFYISRLLEAVLRPFLEEWQAEFRYWWARQDKTAESPFVVQDRFDAIASFKSDWSLVRRHCRAAASQLRKSYHIPDLRPAQ